MGDNFELANLLVTMQSRISAEIHGARENLSTQIEEVKDKQDDHGRELAEVKREQAAQKQDLATLRQTVEDRTGGIGLTKAQKAALWTGLSGLALEGVRHLKALLFALLCAIKAVRP